jgi:hypothetical protein
MRQTKTMLIDSLVWAAIFVLSAYVFRGRPVGPWIQGALLVLWTTCFSYWTVKLPRRSC